MKIHNDTIDFRAVREMLDAGKRVMLFMRHSERPAISTEDKDFGRHLGLTESGVAMAVEAGNCFAGVDAVRFYTSPMERCRLTAKHLAHGMGIDDPEVNDASQIGVQGFYMHPNSHALQALMRKRGYMEFMEEYLNNGSAPYLNHIEPSTLATLEWMEYVAGDALTVFVSHDIYITAFLTALGVRRFHGQDWIGFLHAAVISTDADTGDRHCHYAVPCIREHTQPTKFAH